MRDCLVRKSLVVAVIVLFIGVAVAPSMSAIDLKALALNRTIPDLPGFKVSDESRLKLSKEDLAEIERFFNSILERLDEIRTLADVIAIYNEVILVLDEYGLLPDGMSVDEAQQLMVNSYQKVRVMNHLKNHFGFNHQRYVGRSRSSLIFQPNCISKLDTTGLSEALSLDVYAYIDKPHPMGVYIFDKFIGLFLFCVIIGSITVIIDAGGGDLERVEIIIDGEVVKTFYEPPYEWLWKWKPGDSIFHWLKVTAYGGSSSAGQSFPLLKFF